MEEVYDNATFKSYIDSRDYFKAADYLSKFKAKGRNQIYVDEQINNLRRDGQIQASILQKAQDKDQIDAFHFMNAVNGKGAIPHTMTKNGDEIYGTKNKFGDEYIDEVNSLTVKDRLVNTIGIPCSAEEIQEFYTILGTPTNLKSKYGINVVSNNDGTCELKMNLQDGRCLSALNTIYEKRKKAFNDSTAGTRYDLAVRESDIALSYSIGPELNYYDKEDNQYKFNDLDDKRGGFLGLGDAHVDNIIDAYNSAKSANDKLMEVSGNKMFREDLVVSEFLGAGHAQAYKALKRGELSIDDYRKVVNIRQEAYDNLLKQFDYASNKIYGVALNNENQTMLEFDAKARVELNGMMPTAIKEGRVTYNAAMHGGEMGTLITVAAKPDDGKYHDTQFDKGYRLFIPGLFKSSVQSTFQSDTKMMTKRDVADMEHWNYAINLHDGTSVGFSDGIPYRYEMDESGEVVKRGITREELITQVNRNNIINSSVNTILNNMDDDGNLLSYTDKDGNTVRPDLLSKVEQLANVATNELYPQGEYNMAQRERNANDIYRTILKLINDKLNNNGKYGYE